MCLASRCVLDGINVLRRRGAGILGFWVESLRDLEVKVTGDFRRTELNRTQPEVEALLRSHGARIVNDVRLQTRLLVRADSAMWLYGEFGAREAELATNKAKGYEVGVVDVDELIQLLAGGEVWARDPMAPPPKTPHVGRSYVTADAASIDAAEFVSWTSGEALQLARTDHAAAQNALADFLRGRGLEPLSPVGSNALFDIAWMVDAVIWVAEVKSLNGLNEALQLRLGLGQVLEYSWRLARRHRATVRRVLVPARQPDDENWTFIAGASGVVLTWPDEFGALAEVLDPEGSATR